MRRSCVGAAAGRDRPAPAYCSGIGGTSDGRRARGGRAASWPPAQLPRAPTLAAPLPPTWPAHRWQRRRCRGRRPAAPAARRRPVTQASSLLRRRRGRGRGERGRQPTGEGCQPPPSQPQPQLLPRRPAEALPKRPTPPPPPGRGCRRLLSDATAPAAGRRCPRRRTPRQARPLPRPSTPRPPPSRKQAPRGGERSPVPAPPPVRPPPPFAASTSGSAHQSSE